MSSRPVSIELSGERAEQVPEGPSGLPGRLRWLGRMGAGAAIAGAVVAAFLGPQYLSLNNITLGVTLFTMMALAQAWNLIGGFGGQFSLGHAMFVGTGSYTVSLLLLHTSIPVALAIVLGGVVAAAMGAVLAVPLLRLRGVSFAVGTLGVALAIQSWVIIWDFAGKTTGLNLPIDTFMDFDLQYYAALALALATTVCVVIVARTRFGLWLMAVRDDEDAASQVGVYGFSVKFGAFVLSAFFTGVAGALIPFQNPLVEPYSAFSIGSAITAVVACVIGGLSTFVGPLLGVAIVFEIQQQLKTEADWGNLILGLLMIAIILLAPEGLWGLVRRSPALAVDLVRWLRAAASARTRAAREVGS